MFLWRINILHFIIGATYSLLYSWILIILSLTISVIIHDNTRVTSYTIEANNSIIFIVIIITISELKHFLSRLYSVSYIIAAAITIATIISTIAIIIDAW